jgi:hypothetical protein
MKLQALALARCPGAGPGVDQPVRVVDRSDHRLDAGARGLLGGIDGHLVEAEQRRGNAGRTKRQCLVEAGHAQQVGAAPQERAGCDLHAVAIAVGLDHRSESRVRAHQRTNRSGIGSERVGIDLEPHRAG